MRERERKYYEKFFYSDMEDILNLKVLLNKIK